MQFGWCMQLRACRPVIELALFFLKLERFDRIQTVVATCMPQVCMHMKRMELYAAQIIIPASCHERY